MQSSDNDNIIFQQAAAFVNHTDRHLFLTGKAGTGKTTFLKYIRDNCSKKLAIVAPTGVAAINAGGVTIHSLFQLPFGMYVPAVSYFDHSLSQSNIYNKVQLIQQLKLNRAKKEILQEIELLIIDEVSMLRCDVLDAMDEILRHVRKQPNIPFGNVQVLFIGDLFQLPPVVKQEESALLKQYYATPFFFSAMVVQEAPPICIELTKVYRQSDEHFVMLLNRIRENDLRDEDLAVINGFYNPDFFPSENENYITLTSHNGIASSINQQALDRLTGKLHQFEAQVEGDFPERIYPNDKTLLLKEGAQIMFIKNDKGDDRKYFNGKIAVVGKIGADKSIWIRFPGEKNLFELKKEEWKNIQYKYDPAKDKIEEDEIGSFVQYPVRTAWAITIHKSQGLTFDKAVIDAGAAFAAGQVYVAFSRLRSMDGLVLRSKIYRSAIYSDEQILSFSEKNICQDELNRILSGSQLRYIHDSIIRAFDWHKLYHQLYDFSVEESQKLFSDDLLQESLIQSLLQKAQLQRSTAEKFSTQLERLLKDTSATGYQPLKQRLEKAYQWFSAALEDDITTPLKKEISHLKERKIPKKTLARLLNVLIPFERKKQELKHIYEVVQTMCETSDVDDWLESLSKKEVYHEVVLEENLLPPTRLPKGETYNITLQMYTEGMSVDEISKQRNLAKSTVESHLVRFVETGQIDVSLFLKEDELNKLCDYISQHPHEKSTEIVSAFENKYSYAQIKAAMAYKKKSAEDTTQMEK